MTITNETMVLKQDGLLQKMIDECVTDFWNRWYVNVFRLSTANDFGMSVWSILTGSPRPYRGSELVSEAVWKKYLISRVFQMSHICTLENINKWLKIIFPDTDTCVVVENDGYDADYRTMTLTYVLPGAYFEDKSYQILFSLRDKFFPHPAGVFVEVTHSVVANYIGLNETNNAKTEEGYVIQDSIGQRARVAIDDHLNGGSVVWTPEMQGKYAGILAGNAAANPPLSMDGENSGTVLVIDIPPKNPSDPAKEYDGPDADSRTFKLRAEAHLGKSITITWGDGTYSVVNPGKTDVIEHTYASDSGADGYQVVISNDAKWIKIGEGTTMSDGTAADETTEYSKDAVSKIVALSDYIESMNYMFSYCRNIEKMPGMWPTNCTSAKMAYYWCGKLNDVSAFTQEGVTGSPYEAFIMPPRIASHDDCVSGTGNNVQNAFKSDWGGLKA